MGWWSDRVVPHVTDRALRTPEIGALRAQVCEGLTGDVLEIGFGSGLNLPHLPDGVASVAAVEPADAAWALSTSRRAQSTVRVERAGLDGQALAAPDGSFDSALVTFSLCSIPDPAAALAEVRRVLRPGGRLHFLEHGISPDARVARWQHRIDPVQRRLAGGCHLSRDVPRLLREAGLTVEDLREDYLPGPALARPWSYGYAGRATRG